MAKIALNVTLKKNDGTNLTTSFVSGNKDTFSEAKAAIAAQVDAAVASANQNATDFNDAKTAFES